MNLKKYNQLQTTVEGLRKEANKAAGALDQLMSQLKKEFGCKTLEEAENLLRDLTKKEKRLAKQFEEGLQEFEKDFGEKLAPRDKLRRR